MTITRILQLLGAATIGGAVVAGFTHSSALMPYLSDTDIGFAQDMSGHHQQAVTMTDMLAADASPDLNKLAEEIRFTQLNEIGQMTGWIQLAGAAPSSSHPMAWMHTPDTTVSHHHTTPTNHHHAMPTAMTMPGLASPQELIRLQKSTGQANEVLFLKLMTRHHQGGIDMAAYAAQHTANDAVHRAAAAMIDEQTQEIQIMTTFLQQRNASLLPYP